ncbi:nuclear transport factor 2 family protein [Actinomycetes bacterium M1A6_2h]
MTLNIQNYYATLDGGDLEAAVALLAPDVEFAMILPTGTHTGSGRDAMLTYLTARPPVDRKHNLLGVAADGDVQFAHGSVTDAGRTTGYFVGAMHFDGAGLVDRYQVSFDADFALVPTDDRKEKS